jgi:hypothetical protein
MSEDTQDDTQEPRDIPRSWYRRNFAVFIGGSIVIAFLLVLVSMALYASSGAAQLDLSRPGYKSVQDKVNRTDSFESFPASGAVDNKTIEQFLGLYKRQVKPVDNTDAFNVSALEDQALGIDAPPIGY